MPLPKKNYVIAQEIQVLTMVNKGISICYCDDEVAFFF
jgi:hypothetical protein